jgi:uncharacterized RDD family membrane protein YckC
MPNNPAAPATPTVKRRIISMVYEAFLFLSVEMLATLVYIVATGNRQTPVAQHGLKFFLFLVGAAYFIHFWTDSGHTLAMKTWRIKLVQPGYGRVPLKIAALRYLLAWGWFMPALVVYSGLGVHDKRVLAGAVVAGIVAWALTAFLDKDRQFLHDKLAGTRLVSMPKPVKAQSPAAV